MNLFLTNNTSFALINFRELVSANLLSKNSNYELTLSILPNKKLSIKDVTVFFCGYFLNFIQHIMTYVTLLQEVIPCKRIFIYIPKKVYHKLRYLILKFRVTIRIFRNFISKSRLANRKIRKLILMHRIDIRVQKIENRKIGGINRKVRTAVLMHKVAVRVHKVSSGKPANVIHTIITCFN